MDLDRRRRAELLPQLRVLVVGARGTHELQPSDVRPDRLGWKAFGILTLPAVWTSPFILIDADLTSLATSSAESVVNHALRQSGIPYDATLIVRSSGTSETLHERGRFRSETCKRGDLIATIRNLAFATAHANDGEIHWIVQQYHRALAQGHFSNERRVSHDRRDWAIEIEPGPRRAGSTSTVAVRQWRDGYNYAQGPLDCGMEARISVCLKQVAMWAHRYLHRMHFEWIWDGTRILLVQADREERRGGHDPRTVLHEKIATVSVHGLRAFRLAQETERTTYRKLKNVLLYENLGYRMPSFFVLDSPELIRSLLNGQLPESISHDLSILTARPLVIRTEGSDIPADRREMLPRSEELRSAHEAAHWLTEEFAQRIDASNLRSCSLALLAHHFIPSTASAWARAEPSSPIVRIESLWGIPEGLYWFSHDTFEVDTGRAVIEAHEAFEGETFSYTERLRYKGTFFSTDGTGRWVTLKPAQPFDWKASVSPPQSLSEIAWTTRRIAAAENQPVSVMWFVGNHPSATSHPLLPWFHSLSEFSERPKAAPRHKYRRSTDFRIETRQDWERLRQLIPTSRTVERVIVEPSDASLIRDREFAEQLAALAQSSNFVVELSGGVLSHVFYVLQRSGARVECVDLFGSDENIVEYDKLVRDRIADQIQSRGERAQTVQLRGDALVVALKQKLVEEAIETMDAVAGVDVISELADVLEVVRGLATALQIPLGEVDKERKSKARRRGGFAKGVLLVRTATPRSLHQASGKISDDNATLAPGQERLTVVADSSLLPTRPVYRRPDLRHSDEQNLEKMLTVETDFVGLRDLTEALYFTIPTAGYSEQQLSLVLELRRVSNGIRAVVRCRRVATQLLLDFGPPEPHPSNTPSRR